MNHRPRLRARVLLLFFFVSGFCSLIYEVVWLRLAMASFGVTTPLVSIVLSVFMAGLALGSWTAGRLAQRLELRTPAAALRLYGAAELLIGLSGIVVPFGLRWGRDALASAGDGIAWGSAAHHVAAGAWVSVVLLPFCAAMGATFPLAMVYLRRAAGSHRLRSFSYLYVANVLGAAAGTFASAFFLVELLGLAGTIHLTAALNLALAGASFTLARGGALRAPESAPAIGGGSTTPDGGPREGSYRVPGPVALLLLFMTGLTSMALEVVWVRQLTPFVGTVVYAFAMILTIYLLATFAGSAAYRIWSRSSARLAAGGGLRDGAVWCVIGLFALLSLAAADPRGWSGGGALLITSRVVLGVGPFCAAVGFLTPLLVDRWSSGAADRAGAAYAVNVIGCILGPLLACFLLLPAVGERGSIVTLSLGPFAAGAVAATGGFAARAGAQRATFFWGGAIAGAAAASIALVGFTRDFESIFPRGMVLKDYTATVIAMGEGKDRHLLVNGHGVTSLTTTTKMMSHLPLAFHASAPRSALVICFGMGTSFRSSVSWGIPTTAVELIPSVPSLFGYFHDDARSVLSQPGARIVIDDGRRYLERTAESFDVITVDPPPPVEAAGSSLLYSREFCEAARRRLSSGGILQQWFPGTEPTVVSAVARALEESFPHVRVFRAYEGWGFHFLASDSPIPSLSAQALASRLPPKAVADVMEWEPGESAESHFAAVLRKEVPLDALIGADPRAPTLSDDRPVNEYYLLRRLTRAYRKPPRTQP